ncbi:McrB family protein [Chitinophaga filiformis]|uniref:AAA family ATPase n=1 Tax=Chitinophaga filiformis TaxID=104663 RepID=A0ABY4I5V1_CHIFI|nr:AAA family ATPase [Chitinophaga filiformis]UPK70965.1 AAA family ATPase [Chitinophaga filiformis]
MTELEINKGIKAICDTSNEIASFYADNNALVAKLNSVPQDELQKASDYYASRSGVIVDLRKDVLDHLKDGNKLDITMLDGLVLKHKTGKERQYRSYKNYYSIFFPIITFYGHNDIREFINGFIAEIINRLQLRGKTKHIYFDFQGPRQQGSDRFWFAIFNNKQETQSTGLQLFVDFHNGKVKYGVYKHADESYLKGPIEMFPESFKFSEMLKLFEESKQLILEDEPVKDKLLTIPLNQKHLYKISHGAFKAKGNERIRDIFKENQWIVIHENTQKGQADSFKNDLTEGDYVYITIGGNELFSIAKVKPGSWAYVPEDITNENGWIYREVEYVKSAINADTTTLKSFNEHIYPSGNSTFTEITIDKIEEANKNIFEPHFGVEFISEGASKIKSKGEFQKHPNNIILVGPPGTGKTFNSIDKAVEIITDIKGNHDDNKIVFDKLKKEGQVEFVTFHQNYSYEDFMVGIRPDIENESLRFKPYKGIFYEMAKKARENYFASLKDQPKEKSFQDVFADIVKPLTEKGEHIKIKMTSGVFYTITDISDYSIYFNKPSGDSRHTLSIDTLEEIVDGSREFTTGLGPYYNPLAELIRSKKKESNNNNNKELKKNFVLIIDEINRANISKVFGELITLLEEDKRIDAKNELRLTLPNGEKEFGIPPNLYLIGTMNTADKSIALIDIALRRRFEFIGYFPDYSKLEEGDGVFLKHINKEIYTRKKSADYLIGHAYFMTGLDTYTVIKNKVIPLLMEYFSGKTEVVEEILKNSTWDISYDIEKYDWVIQPSV